MNCSHLAIRALILAAALSTLALPALAQRKGGPPPPASVFVETVKAESFATRIEAIGTLAPNERVDLTLNAADRVTAIYFEDGDRVKKGKTLISLAQREQAALAEAAEAAAAEAAQQAARLEPLAAAGAVSQAELDVARRNANSAAAQLRAVQSRQKDRVLVAPFSGVLGFRNVSIGTYVRPGDTIATLVDDSVMKLDFSVPSKMLAALKPGAAIEASADDVPGQTFSGTVASIDNAIDPVTRSVRVRARIPNPKGDLKAGMFVRVVLLAAPRQSLSVPEIALQPSGADTFIWVAATGEDGLVARKIKVAPGQRQKGRVEITAGLTAGDRVISEGALRVREGGKIAVQDPKLLEPGAAKPARNAAERK